MRAKPGWSSTNENREHWPGAGPQLVVDGAVEVVRRLLPPRQSQTQPGLVVDCEAL